jgi:subtilisin family serine protease
VQIYSTLPNNRYRKLSGTSMATPHIVGLVSVMKSFDKTLNSKKVKKLFKENSIKASYES